MIDLLEAIAALIMLHLAIAAWLALGALFVALAV